MPERDTEISEIRERIVKLEVKVDELNKRVESISSYLKELYKYLHQTPSKSLF